MILSHRVETRVGILAMRIPEVIRDRVSEGPTINWDIQS